MKKKKTRIVLFIFPWELDNVENLLNTFRNSSHLLEEDEKVIIDITLNISDTQVVNWNNSKFDKEYIIEKFNKLSILCDWCYKHYLDLRTDDKILGCVDKRRVSINDIDNDEDIIWLDPDLYFSSYTLTVILQYRNHLLNSNIENYIISPQIMSMWDNTWDCLVNDNYKNIPYDKQAEYIQLEKYNQSNLSNLSLNPINDFKFAGGWFNLFSGNLLKLITIPDTFAPYGKEDLFVMIMLKLLKQNNILNATQYVIENHIVSEKRVDAYNGYWNYQKKYYDVLLPNKDVYRKQVEAVFGNEINKNINRLSLLLKG